MLKRKLKELKRKQKIRKRKKKNWLRRKRKKKILAMHRRQKLLKMLRNLDKLRLKRKKNARRGRFSKKNNGILLNHKIVSKRINRFDIPRENSMNTMSQQRISRMDLE